MYVRNYLKNLFALIVLFFSSFAFAQSSAQYQTFDKPFPSETPNKTEIIEFFMYTCTHCAAIEPMVESMKKDLPEDVKLILVPIAFNETMVPFQKLYYTLESLNRLDLHSEFFNALHKQRQRLFTEEDMAKWAESKGIKKEDFIKAFESFGVNMKVKQASERQEQYKIDSTPTFVVAGKYLTSPAMTGTYHDTIKLVKELIKMN
ncbi:thiol:disulfide interchange protein DsbA/DsbL [Taylorella equigenitalis]|uniref:Thiol:disulfide interchange protein n=3 Tax=Taylorella equigenitalis TaxID=29575 RepID=A0A654KGS8_TAYEM|nr:thiol:disulfide interchange protein DsbA/DsbL [Taylorella equigenitalis]ADU91585.1 Periplasmic thiol:disulfide interchange protein DsbA [Taylorella equigenitalis MCE9]AFN35126.1 thiol:disulfide interchange protein DsbA [Taylorella equigenitalis ATCC 35865]ASY29822.1 thiol:disulfide interchange protein [Taylorella equigenitalis]ASY37125.1 thiol:disulfide interchange protein [Taylorella equigenitalis]ASY38570.1 thiol:disulfide interchange protein [Taylorella equigenitalis]